METSTCHRKVHVAIRRQGDAIGRRVRAVGATSSVLGDAPAQSTSDLAALCLEAEVGGIGECIGAIRRGGETSSPLREGLTFHVPQERLEWGAHRAVQACFEGVSIVKGLLVLPRRVGSMA